MKKIQDIKLLVSKLNPGENFRTIIDPEKITELSKNISEHGMLNPITVRVDNNKYVVVAGKRRLLAAQKANMKEVPCSIYEMTDAEAEEIQLIENLVREDMHPIDEARGYAKLLKSKTEGAKKIDEKAALRIVSSLVGRPEGFIRKRSKLMLLNEEAQGLFKSGTFGYDEAILICRLQPADQEKVLKQCWWGSGKEKNFYNAGSLRQWIRSNCFLKMENAPFPLDDQTLYFAAGACTACPKRTKNSNLLFEDMVGADDACTDPGCFNKKISNFIEVRKKEALSKAPGLKIFDAEARYQDGEVTVAGKIVKTVSKKQFPGAVPAVITADPNHHTGKSHIGQIVHVLPDLKNPKVEKSETEKGQSAAESKKKAAERAVANQCIHFRISLCNQIYKTFMKPGEVKIKKGNFEQLLNGIAGSYSMDADLTKLVIASGAVKIPTTEKSPEDFFDKWEGNRSKEREAQLKKADQDFETMGMGKAVILLFAMGSMFTGRDLGNTYDNLGQVCSALGIDFKKHKKQFLINYAKKLKDDEAMLRTFKDLGRAAAAASNVKIKKEKK